MSDYLAPGVYVEETSYRSRPIEGVACDLTGFVGPTHAGPVGGIPAILDSPGAFERLYGGPENFAYGPNYMAYAVRAYFANGGQRLCVARVPGTGMPDRPAYETALASLDKVDGLATVAAPGYSTYPEYPGIQQALIAHTEPPRARRMAVLETPPGLSAAEAAEARRQIESRHAALYYPWVVAPALQPGDGAPPGEIALPPSGFVCGVYAQNALEQALHRAHANVTLQGVLRLARTVSSAELEQLNPIGVNCLHNLPQKGIRVWGARTTSSDPEWKYVSVRRHMNYLLESIERGTQWAVFEPNGEPLWARVRQSIEDFLHREWTRGALLGSKPEEAYVVRCDRSTLTQADLDHGRLVCQIGVAPVRPAEFVVFRIEQATADARP